MQCETLSSIYVAFSISSLIPSQLTRRQLLSVWNRTYWSKSAEMSSPYCPIALPIAQTLPRHLDSWDSLSCPQVSIQCPHIAQTMPIHPETWYGVMVEIWTMYHYHKFHFCVGALLSVTVPLMIRSRIRVLNRPMQALLT